MPAVYHCLLYYSYDYRFVDLHTSVLPALTAATCSCLTVSATWYTTSATCSGLTTSATWSNCYCYLHWSTTPFMEVAWLVLLSLMACCIVVTSSPASLGNLAYLFTRWIILIILPTTNNNTIKNREEMDYHCIENPYILFLVQYWANLAWMLIYVPNHKL